MKVLVVNAGSSSLKYQLLDMDTQEALAKGLCDRIGIGNSSITHKAKGGEWKVEIDFPTHTEAFMKMVEMMTTGEGAVIKDKSEITAIGHRVVQGAEHFTKSEIVTDEIIDIIEEISPLAPVHNPAHVQGLRCAQKVFGKEVPNVVVFDTTFHQTMPPKAYIYGIPYKYYEENAIRKYGAHGTSHHYVSLKAAEFLGKDPSELKMVTCHLGNGSSISAVDGGKCVDTSMGLTPLAGVLMGTRCGDIDPSVACYLTEITGLSGNKLSDMLNKQSGFLGVSGVSSDKRDLEKAAAEGNERAKLASDMFNYQIKKFIGSYAAVMNGLDCIVFTGGIGENDAMVREVVCSDMEVLGVAIDKEKNAKRSGDIMDITGAGSKVKVLVVPTNEELMIAMDTKRLVEGR